MNWGQILSSLNDGGSVRIAYKFPKYEQDIFLHCIFIYRHWLKQGINMMKINELINFSGILKRKNSELKEERNPKHKNLCSI